MTPLLSPSNWIPPIIERALRRISPRALRLVGPYPDWKAASREASGYEADAILERIASAQRAVRRGEARYERDGVLFDTPEVEFSLLALLQRAAAENAGKLTVLDFGGSLGTPYVRNRQLLDNIALLWQVVEQPHFVELGKQEFEDAVLKFEFSSAQCQSPDVVLSWEKLCDRLAPGYSLLCEIPSAENEAGSGRYLADYRGGIFRKQPGAT